MANNNSPRISVNKLSEYIVSKGKRQRQILRDQKYPQDFKGMYYKEATEAISLCLASNLENIAVLDRTIQRLEQQKPDKVGTQRRLAANVDAIESFNGMLDDIDLQGAAPELGANAPQKLRLQNVDISVRPEIVLRGKGRAGRALVGGIKLHFPRTFPLNSDSAGYVSTLAQEYCKAFMADDAETSGGYCMVLDIGSGAIHVGVKSTTARMRDIVAECRNIAGLWPTITQDE